MRETDGAGRSWVRVSEPQSRTSTPVCCPPALARMMFPNLPPVPSRRRMMAFESRAERVPPPMMVIE